MHRFQIETAGAGLYEFTDVIAAWLPDATAGVLTLFIQHSSASLLIQENADPDVQHDLQNFFNRLVPPASDPSMSYLAHTYEGPDDMPAHIKAALLPSFLSIPVTCGKMMLGRWQGVYLFEHRRQRRRRDVIAHLAV